MSTWRKVGCCLVAAVAAVGAHTCAAGEFPYADYERLEYVRFTGTQYFNTGVTPKADPGYEIDVDFAVSTYVNNGHLFATTAGTPWYYASFSSWSSLFIWGCNGTNCDEAKEGCPAWSAGRHKLAYNRIGDNAVVLDGEVLTTGGEHASGSPLMIGRRGSDTTFQGDVYSFSVTNHSTVAAVIDYVPARERTGGRRVGFYDFVSETFKPAASGTPEAGPVIPTPEAPTIESVVVGNVQPTVLPVTVQIATGEGHPTAMITLSALKDGETEPVVQTFPDKGSGGYMLELSGLVKSSVYQLTVSVDNGAIVTTSDPIAFITPATSVSATYTWVGGSSVNFEDPANWEPNTDYPHGATVAAVLPKPASGATAVTVNQTLDLAALTVGGGNGAGTVKLTFANGLATNVVAGDVYVLAGGTLTHAAHTTSDKTARYKLNLEVGGDMTIAGSVDVDLCGYLYNSPGNPTGASAGTYGGQGRYSSGSTYGSIREPTDLGGNGEHQNHAGGGAVMLDVAGTLTLSGTILSRGKEQGGGCGGTGGSIFLKVGTLAGGGTISANQCSNGSSKYAGSGGRIAIHQRTATDWSAFENGKITAYGGMYENNSTGAGASGSGTIFKKLPNQTYGDLIVNGNTGNIKALNTATTSLSALMTDLDQPFDTVTVTGRSTLRINSGVTLKVAKGIDTAGGNLVAQDATATLELVGTDDFTWRQSASDTFGSFICQVPGKRIFFDADSATGVVIPSGGNLVLKGTEESPLQLLPSDGAKTWNLTAAADAETDLFGLAVSNSVATAGKTLSTVNSTDLGGNQGWSFIAAVKPGDTITWTGASSTSMLDAGNWNPARSVLETDDVVIPAGTPNGLVLTGDRSFNKLTVEEGATLTLAGATMAVTNALAVRGALASTDAADVIVLVKDATFAANAVTGSPAVEFAADDDQSVSLGGNAFGAMTVAKTGTLALNGGFAATTFSAEPTAALSLVFEAGKTVAVSSKLTLKGGATAPISLASSEPDVQWLFNLQDADPTIAYASVKDSDARPGRPIVCDQTVTNGGNNDNWTFGVVNYSWTGGAGNGDFHDAANWSPEGADPADPAFIAEIPRPASGALALTVTNALDIAALTVGGGDGAGMVTLTFANGLTTNKVSGNVKVLAGAKLTHKANTDTELYKLVLFVGGNMTVATGGEVNATLCGYTTDKGPGTIGGQGGSYGGIGANSTKSAYGSIRNPTSIGTGGDGNRGGRRLGGGAIIMDVSGTLTVDGTIVACGESGNGAGGCGSAGGTINLTMGTLVGAGTINADHATDYPDATWSGSGGRIALVQRGATDWSAFASGTVTASGGKAAGSPSVAGGPGTIFRKLPGQQYGDLTVASRSNRDTTGGCEYSTNLEDYGLPFDSVTLSGNCRLYIRAGATLKIAGTLNTRGGSLYVDDPTAAVEFVGTGDSTYLGGVNDHINGLVCTQPGKTIFFGTDATKDRLAIVAGGKLALQGDEELPIRLLSATEGASWSVGLNVNAEPDIRHVAVSNSNASAGATVLAIDSVDLGGNVNWVFGSEIKPGEEIVWTGEGTTSWNDGASWNRGRLPKDTDVVRIPGTAEKMPTMPSGDYPLNQLIVEEGATLTLSTANLTVTNNLSVQGALVCTGTEPITVTGDVDFTGGSVTPGSSDFIIGGETDQTVNLGGCTFNYVNVERAGNVAFTSGFSARHFAVRPSAALTLTFAADETVTVDALYLQGRVGDENLLTLGSSAPGTAWKLDLTKDIQQVTGVTVSDSDASGGVTIRGGSTSEGTDTTNWDFNTNTASWTGAAGTADFATAGNWSPAVVPGADSVVVLSPLRGETVTVVVPANSPVSVKRLMLGSGEGTVKFTAQSPIAIREKLEIPVNATVTLNSADIPNIVSNDVVIKQGGVLTHDELKKLYLETTGDLTVEDGGKIDVNGKGYGPGVAPWGNKGSCGGVYGGRAPKTESGARFAYCYGSIFEPTDLGCGGDIGKRGAGAIRLTVGGTLTVSGSGIITACGTYGGGGGWSGSGGSIFIVCGTLAGAGDIRANTIAKENEGTAYNHEYTGSGGRVAVYERTARDWSAYTGSITADDCSHSVNSDTTAPGTVYRETAADKRHGGTITISGRLCYGCVEFPMLADGDPKTAYRDATLVIGNATVSLQNHDWETAGTSNHVIRVKDIVLTDAKSKVNLCGNVLKVSDGTHRNGRDWEGWDKANPTAAYEKHVNEGGGKIVWTQGTVLFVR